MIQAPSVTFEDGSQFIGRHMVGDPPAGEFPITPFFVREGGDGVEPARYRPWNEAEFRNFVLKCWRDAYEWKRSETARLVRNSCYYDGSHFDQAWLNQSVAIENHVYRVIEVQVSNTVAGKPRPEIVPSRAYSDDTADRLEEFAQWVENGSSYDHAIVLGARDKRIYGWNVWICTMDYETGMPVVRNGSVFEFYWDPAGRNEDECGFFIFAGPRPTWQLRAAFPEQAGQIMPDKIGSPADDAILRPWEDFLLGAMEGTDRPGIAGSGPSVHNEGEQAEDASSFGPDYSNARSWGETTFLYELIVRDAGLKPCRWLGAKTWPDGRVEPSAVYDTTVPRSESGLWVIRMTSQGVILGDPEPVDPCWMGLPFVIDRAKQRTDRFHSMSDSDHVIPIQRGINRRTQSLDTALELSAEPPVLDMQANLNRQLNGGPVRQGETLEIPRGSDVKYLEFRGPDSQQFARLAEAKNAIREIAGIHAALEGQSTGANAPAALARHLDQTAQRRLVGDENAAHRARAQLLRKIMYAAGKKLQPEILFRASDGQMMAVKSEELTGSYTIAFAEGSGNIESRRELKDEALALFEARAIDEQSVLEVFRWPKRMQVTQRMIEHAFQVAQIDAAERARAGPPGKQPGAESRSGGMEE
jgi:hypothetical protein